MVIDFTQRARNRGAKRAEKLDRLREWHTHFSWLPLWFKDERDGRDCFVWFGRVRRVMSSGPSRVERGRWIYARERS